MIISRPLIPGWIIDAIRQKADILGAEIRPVWEMIHFNPETGYEEHIACAGLTAWLKEHGFNIECPVAGMQTAFAANFGKTCRPRIIFLAEYDALPGMGHACGHSLSGVASVISATVLAGLNPPGTITVLGTPAEEGVVRDAGGKLKMIGHGLFRDADAALMSHAYADSVLRLTGLARTVLDVEWHGQAAHAGAAPHLGRNALSAAILALNAINALYQQLPPGCRINPIIHSGGKVVNTIPDFASASIQLRAGDRQTLEILIERIKNCLESGGMATGCDTQISFMCPPVSDLEVSTSLLDVYAGALDELGAEFTDADEALCISTDAGDVSKQLPFIHPLFGIRSAKRPVLHSEMFCQECGSEAAWNGMLEAACALAATGWAVLNNAELRKKMRDEFEARKLA